MQAIVNDEIIDVYKNDIELYVNQYCEEREMTLDDLEKISMNKWNSLLLYIYDHVFKPTPGNNPNRMYNGKSNIDYSNKELLEDVYNIYIRLCYEYTREISIKGFCNMTGIHRSTLYNWEGCAESERGSLDIIEKLREDNEESLSNMLIAPGQNTSTNKNAVAILGALNRRHGWNMGQPRALEVKQAAPSIPDLESKYLLDNDEEVRQYEEDSDEYISSNVLE